MERFSARPLGSSRRFFALPRSCPFKRVFHCPKFIGNLSLEFLMFHLFAYLAIIIFLSISSLFKITLLHVSGKFYSNNRLLSGMPEEKKCKIL